MAIGGPNTPDDADSFEQMVDETIHALFIHMVEQAWGALSEKLGLTEEYSVQVLNEGALIECFTSRCGAASSGAANDISGYQLVVRLLKKIPAVKKGYEAMQIVIVSDANLRRMNAVLHSLGGEVCVQANRANPNGDTFFFYISQGAIVANMVPTLN